MNRLRSVGNQVLGASVQIGDGGCFDVDAQVVVQRGEQFAESDRAIDGFAPYSSLRPLGPSRQDMVLNGITHDRLDDRNALLSRGDGRSAKRRSGAGRSSVLGGIRAPPQILGGIAADEIVHWFRRPVNRRRLPSPRTRSWHAHWLFHDPPFNSTVSITIVDRGLRVLHHLRNKADFSRCSSKRIARANSRATRGTRPVALSRPAGCWGGRIARVLPKWILRERVAGALMTSRLRHEG